MPCRRSVHSIPDLQKLRFFCKLLHYNYWKKTRYVAVEFFVNFYMMWSEMMNYITISFVTLRRYSIHQHFAEARRYRSLDMFDEMSIERSSNHDTVILLHRGNLHLFSGFFHDHFAVEASLKYKTWATSFSCETAAKIALIFGSLYSLHKHSIELNKDFFKSGSILRITSRDTAL